MSEYQYYEFVAVDRPLTAQQQAELRSRSTRATITTSSFVNEYHWGDLKGDPVEWVQRYFDAHVYSANWGSCRLLLRLPRELFEAGTLRDYTGRAGQAARGRFTDAFNATDTDKYWLLDWERVRNNFPKWAWRVQSDAGKMRSFGRIDDAGWLPD